MLMPTRSQLFGEAFLKKVRGFVSSQKLITDRLPKWVKSASVKIGKLNNSNLFLFEDSSKAKDVFVDCGGVKSDLQFFLELSEFEPKAASFKAPRSRGLIILHGEYGEGKKVIFNLVSPDSALFNVGYVPYHSPLAIVNIFIQKSQLGDILATRFVPFALYVHDRDLFEFDAFWSKCTPHLQSSLKFVHDSEAGDYYKKMTDRKSTFLVVKERSVIVFGKYTEPEMSELLKIRDYLRAKDYDAYLLKELPEHPSMSPEEKVKFWALASKFCVMIDRKPSGHLVEYPYIKDVRAILALIKQKGKGSTRMITDERISDFDYIKMFEFENSPRILMKYIDNAITWADQQFTRRSKSKRKSEG